MITQRCVTVRQMAPILTLIIILVELLGCCDQKKIPSKIQALYSSVAKERNDAALDLASCGSDAASAVPRLAELIYDKNVGVQSAAAYALRKIDTAEARRVLQNAEDRRRH